VQKAVPMVVRKAVEKANLLVVHSAVEMAYLRADQWVVKLVET
jgi:hypothetical protein